MKLIQLYHQHALLRKSSNFSDKKVLDFCLYIVCNPLINATMLDQSHKFPQIQFHCMCNFAWFAIYEFYSLISQFNLKWFINFTKLPRNFAEFLVF